MRRPLLLLAALAVAATAVAQRGRPLPPGAVIVDGVPPDACVAVYGQGPCHEHGMTINGSTDAIAGPPPANWRGKVR